MNVCIFEDIMKSEMNLEKLYEKYSPLIFRRCHYLLKDKEKALDAMQDTFVQILKRKKNIQNINLSSYLYKAATNICINILKKRNKQKILDDDIKYIEIPFTDKHEKILYANETLDTVFKKEKKSTRLIATLRYIDKLSLAQTAEIIGLSVSGVRKSLKKLKEKL